MNENAKIRVLIAEDDPIQNDLLKDALELESDMACCGQACDGLEALAKLQTEQPDVLLLDIVMPNMDGVDLLNELRENPPPKRPKVIAISAYGQEHIARAALAQGADWFLLKPYQLELLMRRIRTLAGEAPFPKMKCTLEHIVSKAVIDLGVQTSAVGFLYLEPGTADSSYASGHLPDEQGRIRGNRGPERYYGAMRCKKRCER
mgnify:CR=1 FL=1